MPYAPRRSSKDDKKQRKQRSKTTITRHKTGGAIATISSRRPNKRTPVYRMDASPSSLDESPSSISSSHLSKWGPSKPCITHVSSKGKVRDWGRRKKSSFKSASPHHNNNNVLIIGASDDSSSSSSFTSSNTTIAGALPSDFINTTKDCWGTSAMELHLLAKILFHASVVVVYAVGVDGDDHPKASVKRLLHLGLVCKRWKQTADDGLLWRRIHTHHFGPYSMAHIHRERLAWSESPANHHWKKIVITRLRINKAQAGGSGRKMMKRLGTLANPNHHHAEVYINVKEKLNCTIGGNGTHQNTHVRGVVQVRAFLPPGSPAKHMCVLQYDRKVTLEDITFHPSVLWRKYLKPSTSHCIIFNPSSDNPLQIFRYITVHRKESSFNNPFDITTGYTANPDDSTINISIRLICRTPRDITLVPKKVTVKVPIPSNTARYNAPNISHGKAKLKRTLGIIEWKLPLDSASLPMICSLQTTLPVFGTTVQVPKSQPLVLQWDPIYSDTSMSGFRISSMRVINRKTNKQIPVNSWVRYQTKVGSFQHHLV